MNKRQRKKLNKKRWPVGSIMWIDENRQLPASNGFYNNGRYIFKIVNGKIVQRIDNFAKSLNYN